MKETALSARSFGLSGGVSGLPGVILIVTSFTINPGPSPGSTYAQMQHFAELNRRSILWGAWLQARTVIEILYKGYIRRSAEQFIFTEI
jgi:hypothetical protein